jgi:uncharacterized protein
LTVTNRCKTLQTSIKPTGASTQQEVRHIEKAITIESHSSPELDSMMSYQSIYLDHDIPDLSGTFDITCAPGTDVWDKPPSTHSFNAPIIYQTSTVGSFKSAKVTVSANWTDKYDQGGLCLVVNLNGARKWVKTGVEFENEQPNVSTVATDRWSDWSLIPLQNTTTAVIEMETAKDGSLWVRVQDESGKVTPLREVTWWVDLPKDAECWVGVYVAKPAPQGQKEKLTVHFKDLKVALQ